MKTGLTIQQMAQELLRQSKAKQDYLVNTGSLSLSVTSDAPQLRVTENGLDKITPLDIRQTAHRQLGTYLGIPQKYYELMRTDAPELLAYNANYWFSQKNELRTLRTMDGCARAFLSNRYRRIDNLDIASVTLPVIGELPEARFVSTQITDDFMYIKVVNPRLQADVVPGDVVQAGVIISNSETGLGSVTRFVNEAFLSRRRKVCTGVVRIGLKKAVSGSHEYCVATFTKIADFAGEDLAHIRAYADGFVAQIKDINAQRAQAGAAASSIIGDGDASHLELPDNGAHFALGAVIDGEREELPA